MLIKNSVIVWTVNDADQGWINIHGTIRRKLKRGIFDYLRIKQCVFENPIKFRPFSVDEFVERQ